MNITAVQDAWLIGDSFLRSTYHCYSAMHKKAKLVNAEGLYLTEHYNISSHTMGDANGIRIAAARIQNAAIHQLNNCKTMPRMIIIFPDNDLVKNNQTSVDFFDYGARAICEAITDWLVSEVDDAILERRTAMKKIRRGSVLRGEPKIIYVKMIYRPVRNDAQGLRNIFNNALENRLVDMKDHFIINIETKHNQFDHTNCFTEEGLKAYWKDFDRAIELFDEKPDRFRPVKQTSKGIQTAASCNNHHEQFRLPPPATSQAW